MLGPERIKKSTCLHRRIISLTIWGGQGVVCVLKAWQSYVACIAEELYQTPWWRWSCIFSIFSDSKSTALSRGLNMKCERVKFKIKSLDIDFKIITLQESICLMGCIFRFNHILLYVKYSPTYFPPHHSSQFNSTLDTF